MPVTLDLPSVLVTPGSTYATKVNTALSTLAAATHTGGSNGDKWTAASLNIDGNVSWGDYSITALKATTYSQQASVSTANSVYFKTDGALWCTNGSGTAVQITSGAGLNTSALIKDIWKPISVATNYSIGAALDYTLHNVDTTAARAITLPAANGVTAGRFYIIKDVTGSAATNNITINRAGSDTIQGATTHVIDRNYGFAILSSDGTSSWTVVSPQNASATAHGLVVLAQDLGGTAAAPTVVALTGASGKIPLRSGCNTIEFNAAASTPTITVATNASTAGQSLSITGQGAGGSNQAGGPVYITGGPPTGTGAAGSVDVRSSATNGVLAGAFSNTRRYVAFMPTGSPASADIPTGDGVIYIANAVTAPASRPVGGGILYVEAGALKYQGPTTATPATLAPA